MAELRRSPQSTLARSCRKGCDGKCAACARTRAERAAAAAKEACRG